MANNHSVESQLVPKVSVVLCTYNGEEYLSDFCYQKLLQNGQLLSKTTDQRIEHGKSLNHINIVILLYLKFLRTKQIYTLIKTSILLY